MYSKHGVNTKNLFLCILLQFILQGYLLGSSPVISTPTLPFRNSTGSLDSQAILGEAVLAAKQDRESNAIPVLMDFLTQCIKEFSEDKIRSKPREARVALIITMTEFNKATIFAAKEGAQQFSEEQIAKLAWGQANEAIKVDDYLHPSVIKAWGAVLTATWNAVWLNAKNEASTAVTFALGNNQTETPVTRARIAFRVAESSVLMALIRTEYVGTFFSRAYSELTNPNCALPVVVSLKYYVRFLETFNQLTPQAQLFLQPWLNQIGSSFGFQASRRNEYIVQLLEESKRQRAEILPP